MKVIYLAHKIRDSRGVYYHQRNIAIARNLALKLWHMGFATICPGMNTWGFDGSAPDNVWLDGDLAMVERCDAVVMAPNWVTSLGARGEREHAKKKGIPVYYWPKDKAKLARLAKTTSKTRKAA